MITDFDATFVESRSYKNILNEFLLDAIINIGSIKAALNVQG